MFYWLLRLMLGSLRTFVYARDPGEECSVCQTLPPVVHFFALSGTALFRTRLGGSCCSYWGTGAFFAGQAKRPSMDPNKTTIERAFELARSGECKIIHEIRRQLKVEGYDESVIEGRSLLIQLRTLMADASKRK